MGKINNMSETNTQHLQKVNRQVKRIEEQIRIINETTRLINEKLDELIKALHDYDDDLGSEIE